MVTQPALLAMATRVKSGYLHGRLMDRDLDEHEDDVEIEQESVKPRPQSARETANVLFQICFATVINKHSEFHISHTVTDAAEVFPVRTASIPFIAT
jgi:hypothetical protein